MTAPKTGKLKGGRGKATGKAKGRKPSPDVETSGITSVTPEPIPQPHGGALIPGGRGDGNGGGRPKSAVRAALLQAFDQRISILAEIADSTAASPRERIAALEAMAKYGVGTQQEVELNDKRLLTAEERKARALALLRTASGKG